MSSTALFRAVLFLATLTLCACGQFARMERRPSPPNPAVADLPVSLQIQRQEDGYRGTERLLFDCAVTLRPEGVYISTRGLRRRARADDSSSTDEPPSIPYRQALFIEDSALSDNLQIVARHLEYCVSYDIKGIQDGRSPIHVRRPAVAGLPALEADYYVAPPDHRRARELETLCDELDSLVVATNTSNATAAKHQERVRYLAELLADNIEAHLGALSLLEDGFRAGTPCDWGMIARAVRFNPKAAPQKPLGRLAQETRAILDQTLSADGIAHLLGRPPTDNEALLITLGEATRRHGNDHRSKFPPEEDGFDEADDSLLLGYIDQLADAARPAAMLDVGLQRLLIQFALSEAGAGPLAHDRYSPVIDRGRWSLLAKKPGYNFSPVILSSGDAARLDYLAHHSGLVEWLFGPAPAEITFADLSSLNIHNDRWDTANLGYTIGGQIWVLPMQKESGEWRTHARWPMYDYYTKDGVIRREGSYVRAIDDILAHDRQAAETPR